MEKIERVRAGAGSHFNRLWSMVDDVLAQFKDVNAEPPEDAPVVVVPQQPATPYLSMAPTLIVSVFQPIATLAVVVVLTVYILASREDLRSRLIAIFGQNRLSETARILNDTSERLSRYLLGFCR